MAKKPSSSADAGILAVLRGTALLADVSDRTLAKIAQATRRKSYQEGDTVYEMGDPVENLYFVAAGLSWALTGDFGSRNVFERRAGLADGGYHDRPLRPALARWL